MVWLYGLRAYFWVLLAMRECSEGYGGWKRFLSQRTHEGDIFHSIESEGCTLVRPESIEF